jgi:hypothetical protein
MASIRRSITTRATPARVWDAIRDVGALHTRLVPGFVVDTKLEDGGRVRVVTFGNGMVVHEPIVACDDDIMRLVWTARGGLTTHYNGSVQVTASEGGGSHVTWVADFLPDSATPPLTSAIEAGLAVMKATLDASGGE